MTTLGGQEEAHIEIELLKPPYILGDSPIRFQRHCRGTHGLGPETAGPKADMRKPWTPGPGALG